MGNKKKKTIISDDVVKALNRANRELQFERNGGGQFVATNKVHRNKKKYDRKREKKIDFDFSLFFVCLR